MKVLGILFLIGITTYQIGSGGLFDLKNYFHSPEYPWDNLTFASKVKTACFESQGPGGFSERHVMRRNYQRYRVFILPSKGCGKMKSV